MVCRLADLHMQNEASRHVAAMTSQVVEASAQTAGLQEANRFQEFQDVRLLPSSIIENWRSRARMAAMPGYSRATIDESVPLGRSPGSCARCRLDWLNHQTRHLSHNRYTHVW